MVLGSAILVIIRHSTKRQNNIRKRSGKVFACHYIEIVRMICAMTEERTPAVARDLQTIVWDVPLGSSIENGLRDGFHDLFSFQPKGPPRGGLRWGGGED